VGIPTPASGKNGVLRVQLTTGVRIHHAELSHRWGALVWGFGVQLQSICLSQVLTAKCA